MIDQESDEATLLASIGQLDQAERAFRRLLAQQPDHAASRHNLGVVLLAQGRYAEAAAFHHFRHTDLARPKPVVPWPEWRGESLVGKQLLVFREQGLGDEIMFARFAKQLAEQGASVTLLCSPPLETLFRTSLPVQVLAAVGQVEFPDPDFWCMNADLVTEGRYTLGTLPSAPYLRAQPSRRGGIGIKTRGSPTQASDHRRSLPDDLAAELLSLPGAVDLDPASTGATSFQETAEIVAGLDLVISVCTSVAHLAGAMGKPVWVMLPFVKTYWLWMRGRDDSPWYPSARLFRQGPDENWRPVIDAVKAELLRPDNARVGCRTETIPR